VGRASSTAVPALNAGRGYAAVAHGFREELRRAIETVVSNPRTGPLYGGRVRRYVFPRYPFSLVYILRGEEVEIVAVAQGRRRPGYWRSRL